MSFRFLGNLLEARDFLPLLRWILFTALTIFSLSLVWYYGLLGLVMEGDKSYISPFIMFLYVLTSIHCLFAVVTVSREINRAHRVNEQLERGANGYRVRGDNVFMGDGTLILPGWVADHIRKLVLKAENTHGAKSLDQTLLLRGLADKLRTPLQFGMFMGDSVLKLGLLGTIVGFILMLLPIATLDVSNQVTLKDSMKVMSDGMAVAMYTTLSGLVGSILIRIQYYILDDAAKYLFGLTTDMTEVFVVSALEGDGNGKLKPV